MKLRVLFLSLLLVLAALTAAGAEGPKAEIAFDTAPAASKADSLLLNIKPALEPATVSPSDLLGMELSKMFKEGATKLDPPRPKVVPKPNGEGNVAPTGGRTLRVQAYSYCLTGRTASGRYTAPGVVAVDPRVIPLGSKLYIPGYGWGVAADTGGAIVGNKIDVWFPTLGQCYQWGVRPVTIQVFPK